MFVVLQICSGFGLNAGQIVFASDWYVQTNDTEKACFLALETYSYGLTGSRKKPLKLKTAGPKFWQPKKTDLNRMVDGSPKQIIQTFRFGSHSVF